MPAVQNVTATSTAQSQVKEVLTLGGISQTYGPVTQPTPPQGVYNFNNGLSSGGTVSGNIDLHWEPATGPVTLAAGASVTYTLSALTDQLGRTIAFARIREFLLTITGRTAGTNDYLTLGNAALHPWTDLTGGATNTFNVRSSFMKIDDSPAAMVVTSGTSDQLLIKNNGANPITFTLELKGNSD